MKNDIYSYIKTKKIALDESFGDDIRFVPINILFYKNIKKKTLLKKIKKCKILLRKKGVNDIVLTNELRDILGEKIYKGIPSANLIEVFMKLCKRFGISQTKTIHLYDKNLSVFNLQNLSEIVFMSKNIIIYTDNKIEAKKLIDIIFYEYGVWVEILGSDLKSDTAQIIIDADIGIIRVSDIIANGVNYNLNCGKYNMDLRCLADNTFFLKYLKIESLIAGKNLIKLVDN